jgi:hypothetical protein
MLLLKSAFFVVFIALLVTGLAAQAAILTLHGSLSPHAVQLIAGR